MLNIYNSLTRKKEEFIPRNGNNVKMYTCGVTVYDDCHLGHGRSLYIFEVIRRYLKYKGFNVNFVRNITDVDDKIITKARQIVQDEEISLKEAFEKIRKKYIDSYYEDINLLNVPPADIEPLATKNISEMLIYVQKLIDKGFAYESGGNVYFSVRKFKSYGKLSGKKIDDLLCSVRIDADPFKNDALDFALWKKAKPEEPSWDSPWGPGRPGWHIECSVMSQKYLDTDTLDIHGGGRDLIFPHHENEVAQSEALTDKQFACYWIHHGLLSIDGQKMAKSSGNFITLKKVLEKYSSNILKIFYLQAHYSSPIDFLWDKMEEAKKAYQRIDILIGKLNKYLQDKDIKGITPWGTNGHGTESFEDEFRIAMDDDFNMPKGLAVLFGIVNVCNEKFNSDDEHKDSMLAYARDIIQKILDVFLLTFETKEVFGMSSEEIETKINIRLQCKKEKNYQGADKIRKKLEEKGVILEDTKDGTQWRKKI